MDNPGGWVADRRIPTGAVFPQLEEESDRCQQPAVSNSIPLVPWTYFSGKIREFLTADFEF